MKIPFPLLQFWEVPVKKRPEKFSPPPKSRTQDFIESLRRNSGQDVGGHEFKFTNLSKIFWPEDKTTKRDMLNYYYQVVPYMLPYMKDRPQTFNRFPNGIHGQSFYQKDVTGKVPPWINTYEYYSEGDERKKNFLVCTDEASLLYIASLGCIEMNPWSSRTQSPDNPDWCIIDLDPDKKNTFDQVIEAALVSHQCLSLSEYHLIAKVRDPQVCMYTFRWEQNTPMRIQKNSLAPWLRRFKLDSFVYVDRKESIRSERKNVPGFSTKSSTGNGSRSLFVAPKTRGIGFNAVALGRN